jgi:2-enoate reductase
MGYEDIQLPAFKKHKKILIIGGGPAGIEAAVRASYFGHTVKLVEARHELGGQLIPAGIPESKIEIRRFLDYLRHSLKNSDVELELGNPCNLEIVKKFNPDHIILATGAIPKDLEIIENNKVDVSIQAIDVLMKRLILNGDVVVVGGGPVGLDVAEFISSYGARVKIVDMKKIAGDGLEWNTRKMKIKLLENKGCIFILNTTVLKIDGGCVKFRDQSGKEGSIHADFVVMAAGSNPFNPLEKRIWETGIPVTCIGDCKRPRGLAEAISEAFYEVLRITWPEII